MVYTHLGMGQLHCVRKVFLSLSGFRVPQSNPVKYSQYHVAALLLFGNLFGSMEDAFQNTLEVILNSFFVYKTFCSDTV